MIHISVSKKYRGKINKEALILAAGMALKCSNADLDSELTIVIDEDRLLQQLNQQFLGEDKPTDVLSFPSDAYDLEKGQRYLGDVVISYPIAEAQAFSAGHSTQAEMQLLVVHGVLHLLGHDHITGEQKAAMWAMQKVILAEIGCELNKYPE